MMRFRNILCIIIWFLGLWAFAQDSDSNLSYVDPTIGGVGLVLQPTRPTVHLPNSMLRMHPIRKDQLDDQIDYFPLNIASHRISSVFSFMPVSGVPNADMWEKRTTYYQEINKPHYYRSELEVPGLSFIEFTPSHRSGYFRIKFEGNQNHYLRLGTINNNGKISIIGKRVITGVENFSGMKAYFYAETNIDIGTVLYMKGDKNDVLAQIAAKNETVDFKYGISYISVEQAKKNLQKEIPAWNFDRIKKKLSELGMRCYLK